MREIISPLSGIRSPFGGRSLTSPAALFIYGEQGVWFDPSDVANLTWRRNLLTWTEQFDNAAWTGSNTGTLLRNQTDPNGIANSATTLIANNAGGNGQVFVAQNFSTTSGLTYTLSAYIRAGTLSFAQFNIFNGFANSNAAFNFSAVTASVISGSGSALITPVGGGWYRCSITATSNATVSNATFRIALADDATDVNYLVDRNGTNSIIVFGAQLELGSVATTYQPITTVDAEVIARFPTATLYQDTAGTTPVTTTGQSVGLMLDKSKGLVLGSELVTNGTFDSGITGWTKGAGTTNPISWDSVGQRLLVTNDVAYFASATQVISGLSIGRSYRVTGVLSSNTVAAKLNINGLTPESIVSVGGGIASFVFVATATSHTLQATNNQNTLGGVAYWDNISVKELPGNHAVQATTANRPIYGIHPFGGRRNLLVRTEEFDSVSWTKVNLTATANAGTAPDGTVTADKLVDTTRTNAFHQPLLPSSGARATTHTVSAYAEAAEPHGVTLLMDDGAGVNFAFAQFNLSAGTAGTIQYAGTGYSGGVTSIQDVGSGWYRCSVTASRASAYTARGYVEINDGATRQYTGNTSSGILIWGAQLELGSTATNYQRVTDQYNVTEAGVPSVSYLFFDGVNDSLATPTITPGVDKAQVFAGVRKLSDAAVGMVVETSANINSNAGAFRLTAPASVGPSYSFGSRGSGAVADALQLSGYTAPISNVLTGIGDIAGDIATLRVNGTQAAQSTGDQGAGNYLAYPLYIGHRFNNPPTTASSLFFSGHLYSLIARFGPNLATGQISSTETWVAGRTGGTI